MKKKALLICLLVFVLASSVFAAQNFESIHGMFSGYRIVRIIVDGREIKGDVPGIIVEGRTMVPVRFIVDALGGQIEWDESTFTVNIETTVEGEEVENYDPETEPRGEVSEDEETETEQPRRVEELVDPYKASIDLDALGIHINQVDAFKLEKRGDQEAILLAFYMADDKVYIGSKGDIEVLGHYDWQTELIGYAGGHSILEFNQEYVLKVFTRTGERYEILFRTDGLPALSNNSVKRQVVIIPAMPEKGFYWPYILAIPNTNNKAANIAHSRYLMVDINNTGSTNNFEQTIHDTREFVSEKGVVAIRVADELWAPLMVPIFPRPRVGYAIEGEWNNILTHSLDRDTAIMHLKMQDPDLKQMLIEEFENVNINVHHLKRLDLQLIAMFDHAIEYLNQQEFNLEPDKVFLCGYSASGTFTDRFATFHPERVKALASGATLDDMILPLAEYRGKQLIFPIGTYDFKEITGREFCMKLHNQVARLIHMGKDDTANVLPYNDCYGDRERAIITELWGVEILPRAKALIELYGKSGGKGIFILDRGQGHWESQEMEDYILSFFKANRDSDTPVYIIPSNPAQLIYTLFE